MEKSKDCPLCGKKNAIKPIPYKKTFSANPGPKGVVGNYRIGHEGGGYDYSHAESCPKLVHAYEKEYLLKFYVDGYSNVTCSDMLNFEDYEKFFHKKGFKLEVKCKTKKQSFSSDSEWYCEASLSPIVSLNDMYCLVSVGKEPARAFEILRHRLICGDIIETKKGRKKIYLQLVKKGGKLHSLRSVEF